MTDVKEEFILLVETNSLKKLFSSKFSFDYLWDEIVLSVLPNHRLDPQRIILFYDLRNKAQIKILEGSGYFKVKTNEADLLNFEYDNVNSLITVSPIRKGYASIIVEDGNLVHSKPASCEIIICDAAHLVLKTETNLLSLGNKTLMHVSVHEINNEIIPEEQYHLMKIYLQIDSDSEYLRSNALGIEPYLDQNNVFVVEGRLVGSFKVKAFMTIPSNSYSTINFITSNVLELHVFENLRIHPPSLLMSPGCVSNVELIGGPSEKSKVLNNVVLEATLSERNVVTSKEISNDLFEINAEMIGEVKMTFVLKFKDTNKIINSVMINIKVALVRDVEILGMIDRKLHVGSVVRLIALSKSFFLIIILF